MATTSDLFFELEEEVNPHVNFYSDAFYLTVTTATKVGDGNLLPMCVGGKVIVMLLMLLGTLIVVSFTAVLASAIIEADTQVRTRLWDF